MPFKKLKTLSINLSLGLISLIIAITAAEVILRFTEFKRILYENYTYPAYYFVPDELLGYDIGSNITGEKHSLEEGSYELFSNSHGCFDYERDIPDDYGVIVGDSFTWGYTSLDKKWTTRLEELSGVFMLKCGVTGYGTKQELIKAQKVIASVGKNPKFLIVLYTHNDLHDDFAFPGRTVIGGYMVGTIKTIDLITGRKSYFSESELMEKYNKYISGSFSNRLRKLRYNMITYRLLRYRFIPYYEEQKLKTKSWLESRNEVPDEPVIEAQSVAEIDKKEHPTVVVGKKQKLITTATSTQMGFNTRVDAYDIPLKRHLDDYETEWYQDVITNHSNAIKGFKKYADSIGSQLFFIDAGNLLTHPRFADVRQFLGESYYSLASDYPVHRQGRWKYDRHWNVEGNQKAGEYIYNHFKQVLHADSNVVR